MKHFSQIKQSVSFVSPLGGSQIRRLRNGFSFPSFELTATSVSQRYRRMRGEMKGGRLFENCETRSSHPSRTQGNPVCFWNKHREVTYSVDSGAVHNRRGAVIVMAMVALLLASLMIAALVRTTVISHQQMIRDEYRIQANLLADAGCARALYQLSQQEDFAADVWTIPSEQLAPGKTAEVRVSITTEPMSPHQRIVAVVAEYPTGHPDFVRAYRSMTVPINK